MFLKSLKFCFGKYFLWRHVFSGFHSHPSQVSVLLKDVGMVEEEAGQACWCWSMVWMVQMVQPGCWVCHL